MEEVHSTPVPHVRAEPRTKVSKQPFSEDDEAVFAEFTSLAEDERRCLSTASMAVKITKGKVDQHWDPEDIQAPSPTPPEPVQTISQEKEMEDRIPRSQQSSRGQLGGLYS